MNARRQARRVEVLSFEGCPNEDAAVEAVREVAERTGAEAEILVTRVATPEEAVERRFLGSPTIRVDGRDVEPGAEERTAYVLACRVYPGEHGPVGVPDARWISAALESPGGGRASERR